MNPSSEKMNTSGGSCIDNRPSEEYAARSSADDKLQILQLQCIIDAKDREICLLRDKLSGQEDSQIITALESDVTRLQQEVQGLGRENAALHAQLLSATGEAHAALGGAPSTNRAVSSEPASSGPPLPPAAAASQFATPRPVDRPTPSTPSVDADVLIHKLRSVVSGLVADALAVQQPPEQGQQQQQPGHDTQGVPGAMPGPQPQAPPQAPGGSGGGPVTPGWGASGWAPALPCVLLPLSYFPSGVLAAPASWVPAAGCPAAAPLVAPWCQPPPAPLPPTGTHTEVDSSGGPSRGAVPGPVQPYDGHVVSGTSASESDLVMSTGSAPAVLEINVDGSPMCLERGLLEAQARGSRLYELLVRKYEKLPRDSHGRPFLSYDPAVFQALLSALKDRWLLGPAAPPRNWLAVARSLGVHVSYFKMVASHFGLGEEVSQDLQPADDSNTTQHVGAPPAPQRSASSSQQQPVHPPPPSSPPASSSSDMAEAREALAGTATAPAARGGSGDGGGVVEGGAPAVAGPSPPRVQVGGGNGTDMPQAAAVARFRVANMYSLLAQKQAAEAAREGKEGQGTR